MNRAVYFAEIDLPSAGADSDQGACFSDGDVPAVSLELRGSPNVGRANVAASCCYSHSQDRAAVLIFRTGPVERVGCANPIAGCSGYFDRISLALK